MRLPRVNLLLLLTVVIPTVLATIYFGLVASDVYVSESQFVVRSPERQATSPLGVLLRGAGFSRAQDDSYTVHEFVLSRDALQVLNKEMNLGQAYGAKTVDVLSRFAGIDPDNSFEALHRYYRGKVQVRTDASSNITTLSVNAFTAEDAARANRMLLEASESLVNRLNERGRQDMIQYAMAEVLAAQKQAKGAAFALSQYRNSQGVVDPERQAAVQLQQIAKLQDELIASSTLLTQLKSVSPLNPQVQGLETRIRMLRQAMDNESSRITGGRRSLADKSVDFQRFALDSDFANKQVATALSGLEQARNEARRQQVYLERVAQPSTPDYPAAPRRIRAVLTTLALGLLAWGIAALVVSSVNEHKAH
ncbi:hypothetical protein [Caenimonas soli]|uniref:hypothetical protein n=1 Tax=Caenimonas soli TaxID=2735555 RepID=UPI001F244096|nr:hypothetical protein [Caenimonas soli]